MCGNIKNMGFHTWPHLGGFKTTDNIKDAWGVENDCGIFQDRSALHTQIYKLPHNTYY